jgi:quinol monooxygenase YgiN
MTVFFATLRVKPGREQQFEKLQRELASLTHESEPGTIVYDVVRLRDRTGQYAVYARFKDQAAFELHQATPFHDRLVPPILECLDGGAAGMDLAFYDWVG